LKNVWSRHGHLSRSPRSSPATRRGQLPAHPSVASPQFSCPDTFQLPAHSSVASPPFSCQPALQLPAHPSVASPPFSCQETLQLPAHPSVARRQFSCQDTLQLPAHPSVASPLFNSSPSHRPSSLCFSVASSLTQLEGSNPATMALVEEPRIDESSQEKISNRPM
jgi:hypothetical protein